MLWMKKGEQATYRKPRGQILMASGFVCRCHGHMVIPVEEVPQFLVFCSSNDPTDRIFTLKDFPKLSKVCASAPLSMKGALSSMTIILPGKRNGEDDYWVNQDVCDHTNEFLYMFKFIHRRNPPEPQPEMVAIFDGSSNHAARAPDALHTGGGVNISPGGVNAPGSPPTKSNPLGLPKMRPGWFTNKVFYHPTNVCHTVVLPIITGRLFFP